MPPLFPLVLGLALSACQMLCGYETDDDTLRISIEPPSATLLPGEEIGLRARCARGGNGSCVAWSDCDVPVDWSSSDPTVVAVDGDSSSALASARSVGTAFASASAEGASGSAAIWVIDSSSLRVEPRMATIEVGQSLELTALGTTGSGPERDLTKLVEWVSDDEAIAIIEWDGIATGVGIGSTTIRTLLGNSESQPAVLTVVDLTSIDITPTEATIRVWEAQAFVATGVWSDGTVEEFESGVVWSSSDPSVASFVSPGVAFGDGPGTVEITAARGTVISPSASLTVRPRPPIPGELVINELLVRGQAGDANGDGTIVDSEEVFIEIVSVAPVVVALDGLTMYEPGLGISMPRHVFGLVSLEPNEAVVVFGGGSAPADTPGAQFRVANAPDGLGLSLDLTSDTISVKTAMELIVELAYGGMTGIDASVPESINLDPDITGTGYVPHSSIPSSGGAIFSPGTHVDGAPFP